MIWFLVAFVVVSWLFLWERIDALKAQLADAKWWHERDRKERDEFRLGELAAMERVRELEAWIANPPKAKKGGAS